MPEAHSYLRYCRCISGPYRIEPKLIYRAARQHELQVVRSNVQRLYYGVAFRVPAMIAIVEELRTPRPRRLYVYAQFDMRPCTSK